MLADRREVSADRVPITGDLLGAEPSGYLLLGLCRAQVPLCVVGGGCDPRVADEPQHVGCAVTQAVQQIPAGRLLAGLDAAYPAEAEDDPVAEHTDQRRSDV